MPYVVLHHSDYVTIRDLMEEIEDLTDQEKLVLGKVSRVVENMERKKREEEARVGRLRKVEV